MKVVYATRSAGHISYVTPVTTPLSAAGHEVEMLFHPDLAKDFPDEKALQALARGDRETARFLLRRSRLSRWRVESHRNLLTYSSYLTRSAQSAYYRRRWEQYLAAPIRWSLPIPGVRRLIAGARTKRALAWLEARTAPPARVVAYLREKKPGVLMASPLNYWGSEEVEYVKAAKQLGIPTVLNVFSWDNLTTKSLLYSIPDLVLVWNRKQVDEATEIHGVPPERVVITGAPHFDEIFACLGGGISREELCAKAGLDARRPYVAYLGSSSFIAEDETWLVKEIASALAAHADPDTRAVQILVRPHPAHAKIYESIEDDRIKVWPKRGAKLGSAGFVEDFHDTLHHAAASVGINTSGLLNAVIEDKPCVTILAPRYQETQSQAMHFQHLLEGDVLETTRDAPECASAIAAILRGRDARGESRRRFARDWFRPRGLERPAGEIIAQAVELHASGLPPRRIDEEIARGSATLASR